jgi:NADH:ubiquinone oxidoreductase subunit E
MKKLLVCTNFRANPNNSSCAARGSEDILGKLKQELRLKNVHIEIENSPCMGYCMIGPNARLIPSGPFIHGITTQNLSDVIRKTKKFLKEKSNIK